MNDLIRGMTVLMCFFVLILSIMLITRWVHEWGWGKAGGPDREVLVAAGAVNFTFLLIAILTLYGRIESVVHHVPHSYRDWFSFVLLVSVTVTEFLILSSEKFWRPSGGN